MFRTSAMKVRHLRSSADRWLQFCAWVDNARYAMRKPLIRVLASLMAFSLPWEARADDDWAGMLNSWAQGASSGTTALLTIAKFAGAAIFIFSLVGFKQVGKNPHITAKGCFIGLLIGAGLFSIGALINRTQSQTGLSTTTVS